MLRQIFLLPPLSFSRWRCCACSWAWCSASWTLRKTPRLAWSSRLFRCAAPRFFLSAPGLLLFTLPQFLLPAFLLQTAQLFKMAKFLLFLYPFSSNRRAAWWSRSACDDLARVSKGVPRRHPCKIDVVRVTLSRTNIPLAHNLYIIEGSASAYTSASVKLLVGSVPLSKSFAMCRGWYGRLG